MTVLIPGSYCLSVSLPIVVGTVPLARRTRSIRLAVPAMEAAPPYEQEVHERLVKE